MPLLFATVFSLGILVLPFSASADTNYNATIPPGEQKKLAEEHIWGDAAIQGTQRSVYSGGNCGVQYIVKDSDNNTIKQYTQYGNKTVNININLDLGALGEKLSLWGKNLYKGAKDAVKAIGKFID